MYFFHQPRETPMSAKAGLSEPLTPKPVTSIKDSLSPKNEEDTTGDLNGTSWVVDSSGFLSPNGPALKEVLDMVDGVRLFYSP